MKMPTPRTRLTVGDSLGGIETEGGRLGMFFCSIFIFGGVVHGGGGGGGTRYRRVTGGGRDSQRDGTGWPRFSV